MDVLFVLPVIPDGEVGGGVEGVLGLELGGLGIVVLLVVGESGVPDFWLRLYLRFGDGEGTFAVVLDLLGGMQLVALVVLAVQYFLLVVGSQQFAFPEFSDLLLQLRVAGSDSDVVLSVDAVVVVAAVDADSHMAESS